MIAADVPVRGRMYYLVDDNFDFISEVKDFLDLKSIRSAPATIEAYCYRLLWYYRFLVVSLICVDARWGNNCHQ